MIDFSNVRNIVIPEGEVSVIRRGDEILWKKMKLPLEYQEVEYIESTGTQWIDTGYKINNNSEIELVINLLGSNNCDVFGSRASKSNVNFENVSVTTGTSSLFVIDFTSSDYTKYRVSTGQNTNNCKAKIVVSKNERSVTNLDTGTVLASNKTVCNDVFACDTNTYLLHVSGEAYFAKATEKAKLYSLKIAELGTLTRDFIPCYRKNDGEVGLYDTVTETFFTNAGTGEFVCQKPKYKTELAYLESTGGQYINTGWNPGANAGRFTFDIEVQNTTNEAGHGAIGSRSVDAGRNWVIVNIHRTTDNKTVEQFGYGSTYHNLAIESSNIWTRARTYIDSSNYVFEATCDDTTLSEITPLQIFTNTANIYLFGINNKGSLFSSFPFIGKIRKAKFYDSGVLIKDFIPVLDWNDRPCMYDKVSEELFYNRGTGEFAYG